MKKTVLRKTRTLFISAIPLILCLNTLAARAQSSGITLKMERTPMIRVMDEIEKQTRYLFVNRGVDTRQSVNIEVSNATIQETLNNLFSGKDVEYEIDNTSIIISNKGKHPVTVTGIARDQAGEPVVGATVIIAGTNTGTSTGIDGTFALQVPHPTQSARLIFSHLSYETHTVPVGTNTFLDVTMRDSSVEMDNVVVTALGIKRSEKALSYNVQQISANDITDIKDANFINSLSGKIAGAVINASSSGVGGASKVVLRGNKSISQSSNALYVIDGIPMFNFGGGGEMEFGSKGATDAIADINPEDIESISVLTGASAAALYGSNAANGAVLITTKKGGSGRPVISYTNTTEILKPFVLPSFQTRYGTGSGGKDTGSSVYSWGRKLAPAAQTGYSPNDFFETGLVETNSLTFSGGSDRNQTFFSAASVNSKGIIPNNGYNRYNFTFRNTSNFYNDKLTLDIGASYILQDDRNMTNQGVYSNPLVSAYLFPRGDDFSLTKKFERYDPGRKIMTQYWPQGEGGDLRMQNPYWIAYRNLRENNKKRYMLSAAVTYDILQWLNVSGRVRVDNSNNLFTEKLYASSNTTITEGSSQGFYAESRSFDTQTYADAIVNINKNFGNDWSLAANVGASINNMKTDMLTYKGPIRETGLPNVFNVFDLDDTKKRATKEGWREQTQSVFASVELGWKSMLYLTVTGRNDWASQLANSPQSSFFYPSAGLSWLPGETFDLPREISYLKIRGSYSSVGIPFPRHLTVPTYEYDATTQSWKPKTHYPIGKLYPERTKTWEVGLDTRLWQDLSFNISFYRADTYNQTFDPQISVSSGYSTIYLQTGHVRNTGIEASLGYDRTWNDFRWNTNYTFSWNRNNIVELVSDYAHPETGELITKDRLEIKGLGKSRYILKPGGTLGDLYTTSDLKYNDNGYIDIDANGNVITTDNAGDIKLGSVFPKYNMAWRNDFSWKGLRLGVLFTARIGGIVYSATQANMDLFGVSEASAAARDAGGVVVNGRQMSIDPQAWYTALGSQSGLPQYYTYSATNVRLQELSIGYTIPRRVFGDVCSITVSLVGKNLWMIYNKAPFDPEAVASTDNFYQGIDYFMMPSLRSMGFNLKINF